MPILSFTTSSRQKFQRSVSLTSYVYNDIKLLDPTTGEARVNIDNSESKIDINHLRSAIIGQKKIVNKCVSLPDNFRDINNNHLGRISDRNRKQKSQSVKHGCRYVSSNEFVSSHSDSFFSGPIFIDVSLSWMITRLLHSFFVKRS